MIASFLKPWNDPQMKTAPALEAPGRVGSSITGELVTADGSRHETRDRFHDRDLALEMQVEPNGSAVNFLRLVVGGSFRSNRSEKEMPANTNVPVCPCCGGRRPYLQDLIYIQTLLRSRYQNCDIDCLELLDELVQLQFPIWELIEAAKDQEAYPTEADFFADLRGVLDVRRRLGGAP